MSSRGGTSTRARGTTSPAQEPFALPKASGATTSKTLETLLDATDAKESFHLTNLRVRADLAARVANNTDFVAMAADQFRTPTQMASHLVASWQSGQRNEWQAAQQLAARDAFGLKAADVRMPPDSQNPNEDWQPRALYAQYGAALRAFVQANYAATQEYFARAGVQSVTVYRGMRWNTGDRTRPRGVTWNATGEASLRLRPLSAFSATRSATDLFMQPNSYAKGAGAYRMLVSATVPVSRIFSIGMPGLGDKSTSEVIVLGGRERMQYESTGPSSARPRRRSAAG